jgi:hypothetical protein
MDREVCGLCLQVPREAWGKLGPHFFRAVPPF